MMVLFFIILSLILFLLSKAMKRDVINIKTRYKIQEGMITYSDLSKPAKVFFSKRFRIAGKPDYIIKKNKHYIPVEFKTSKSYQPQNSHIFQLAGYCHLLEENFGGFVPYGILVYNDIYEYEVPFDPKLRYEFEYTLKNMRNAIKTGKISRNHSDFNRCKSCSMRTYCQAKLS